MFLIKFNFLSLKAEFFQFDQKLLVKNTFQSQPQNCQKLIDLQQDDFYYTFVLQTCFRLFRQFYQNLQVFQNLAPYSRKKFVDKALQIYKEKKSIEEFDPVSNKNEHKWFCFRGSVLFHLLDFFGKEILLRYRQ